MQIRHRKRIFNVGRLDKDSTGIILLTNDGRAVNALLRAQHGQSKRYAVEVNARIHDRDLQALAQGVEITTEPQRDGGGARKQLTGHTQPCQVERVRELAPGHGCMPALLTS
jgi:pseudouridine synthase